MDGKLSRTQDNALVNYLEVRAIDTFEDGLADDGWERSVGFGKFEQKGAVVDDFYIDVADVVGNILGLKWRTVLPGKRVGKSELISLAIIEDFPVGGKIGNRIAFPIDIGKAVTDLRLDVFGETGEGVGANATNILCGFEFGEVAINVWGGSKSKGAKNCGRKDDFFVFADEGFDDPVVDSELFHEEIG